MLNNVHKLRKRVRIFTELVDTEFWWSNKDQILMRVD